MGRKVALIQQILLIILCMPYTGSTHHIVKYLKEDEVWLLSSRKVQFRFWWNQGRTQYGNIDNDR